MSEGFTVSARQTGRPAALTGDRERECYELLERLGIAYEWVEFSRQPETTAEAEEVDKALGVPGLKNLIFQNRNRSRTLFLLLPREKRLDAKALAKSRNITRLSMVNAAALEDLLHTHAGAVGAMELMYDMEGKLELFIDREVLDGPFVRFPPNADGRLVRIATSDFVDKLLPAIKHGYTVLEADDPAFTGAEILPEAPFAFRKMRRSRQQLRLSESRAILERGTCGVLALAGDGGYPYALPMSYAYREGKIYFHAARTGHKIDAIARCPKASFCVVIRTRSSLRSSPPITAVPLPSDASGWQRTPKRSSPDCGHWGRSTAPAGIPSWRRRSGRNWQRWRYWCSPWSTSPASRPLSLYPSREKLRQMKNCKKEEFQCKPQNI